MGKELVAGTDIELFELSTVLDRLAERVRGALNNRASAAGLSVSGMTAASPGQMVMTAEALYRERRRRERVFEAYGDLLSDHVFDMLLTLFIGHEKSSAVSLSSACYAAGTAQSTGLRYIARLEQLGLISRYHDPADKRRQLLDLTPGGQALMESYLGGHPGSPATVVSSH